MDLSSESLQKTVEVQIILLRYFKSFHRIMKAIAFEFAVNIGNARAELSNQHYLFLMLISNSHVFVVYSLDAFVVDFVESLRETRYKTDFPMNKLKIPELLFSSRKNLADRRFF